MPFSLESKVFIREMCTGLPAINHVVVAARKELHEGDILKAKGLVATDVEGRERWVKVSARIQILYDKLEISWDRGLLGLLLNERSNFGTKIIVPEQPGSVDLDDYYLRLGMLPTAFSFLQRLRMSALIKDKEQTLGGIKSQEESTQIIFERSRT